MLGGSQLVQDIKQLRAYVNEILCRHHQLEPDAFPLTERVLVRAGRPCGIMYCLHGPRAVKFSAIWEAQRNTVLFYDAVGQRYHKEQLAGAVALERG